MCEKLAILEQWLNEKNSLDICSMCAHIDIIMSIYSYENFCESQIGKRHILVSSFNPQFILIPEPQKIPTPHLL